MLNLYRLIFGIASDLLRSRVALEAEILVLRQQINVLRRANPKRLRFVSIDRLILGGVCRLVPKMYGSRAIVRPETLIRRHRAGFRSYWRWKSKLCLPQIKPEHIGDAVHPGSDGTECVPLPRRHVISARPCSTIGECACHYSIGRNISEC